MMQAWQILCLAIALWRAGPPRPEEVEWTEHDRGLWLQLWKSETGKKVRELMARHEMTAAKSALQRQDAGLALGGRIQHRTASGPCLPGDFSGRRANAGRFAYRWTERRGTPGHRTVFPMN